MTLWSICKIFAPCNFPLHSTRIVAITQRTFTVAHTLTWYTLVFYHSSWQLTNGGNRSNKSTTTCHQQPELHAAKWNSFDKQFVFERKKRNEWLILLWLLCIGNCSLFRWSFYLFFNAFVDIHVHTCLWEQWLCMRNFAIQLAKTESIQR